MGLKDLGYKPREAATGIVMDDEARQELEAATAAYALYKQNAQQGDLAGEQTVTDRLTAAQDRAKESTVVFRFRAKPRRMVEDLVKDCPPSEAELERWKQQARAQPLVAKPPPEFDWYKFAPRLIAMSMIEPEATEAEVIEMWDSDDPDAWSDAIWDELWDTAWSVNQQISTRPIFGNDSKPT